MITDLRQAVRGLRKAPALTAVAIASLALGIGANATVFSVVREMILDDVSARNPDRLVRIEGVDTSVSMYKQLRAAGVFQDLAFHRGLGDRIWSGGERNQIVWRLVTSSNFFDLLGVHAFAGRLYTQADDGRALAVCTYSFWSKRLHSDPHVLGRSIRLEGRPYTLTGVLPRDYRSVYGHAVSPELYLLSPGNLDSHESLYSVIGRLRGGAS